MRPKDNTNFVVWEFERNYAKLCVGNLVMYFIKRLPGGWSVFNNQKAMLAANLTKKDAMAAAEERLQLLFNVGLPAQNYF